MGTNEVSEPLSASEVGEDEVVISFDEFRDRVRKATDSRVDLTEILERMQVCLHRINKLMEELRSGN